MKKYRIKPEAAYKNTWLAPWAGYEITLFKKSGCMYYSLFGISDKASGYFTKKTIENLLTPIAL